MEWKLVDHRSSEKTFNGHLRKNARLLPLRQTANDFYGRCMTSRSSRSIVRLKMQKTYAALITQTPSESQVAACWETRQILLKNARNGSCGSDEWHSMLVIRFITICASLDGSKSARELPVNNLQRIDSIHHSIKSIYAVKRIKFSTWDEGEKKVLREMWTARHGTHNQN